MLYKCVWKEMCMCVRTDETSSQSQCCSFYINGRTAMEIHKTNIKELAPARNFRVTMGPKACPYKIQNLQMTASQHVLPLNERN